MSNLDGIRKFDLNIEQVLENWEVYHALREIIANALDEQILTKTKDIEIIKKDNITKIRDFGRGLKYEHLTQNENQEKLTNSELVIGKFGVGLKDALATLNRYGIDILIKTKYGDITLEKTEKHGFDDIITLHAVITTTSEPNFVGTEFSLVGCNDEEVSKAKNLFLIFSGEKILDKTKYGQILEKKSKTSNIYINGVKVAEESNFLFSYNITSMTAAMRKSLNRERTNVGRSAYTERIKSILLASDNHDVAKYLADDLGKYAIGTQHEELKWNEISQHACKIRNSNDKVVFVTPEEQSTEKHLLDSAKRDGLDIVIIPDVIKERIQGVEDIQGNVMRDVSQYNHEYVKSFEYKFILETALTDSEKNVFEYKDKIMNLVGGKPDIVKDIKISETMRVGSTICGVAGLWSSAEQVIIIRRDQLSSLSTFACVLLHEIAHAKSGHPDVDQGFEITLSTFLGNVSVKALD